MVSSILNPVPLWDTSTRPNVVILACPHSPNCQCTNSRIIATGHASARIRQRTTHPACKWRPPHNAEDTGFIPVKPSHDSGGSMGHSRQAALSPHLVDQQMPLLSISEEEAAPTQE
ncbi:hypothetical protein P7K49_040011 [Saguinus oedipus]|uniref:Uncharacterized protein n=1 Tax=Saguinus oedipus TaxID=9490 RepID=A0ABQ9TDK4_SAGOE|nr:hypothetical protein P7K49_040060 [Saguinus oedipus]KAK2082630.1 hypothetical protein P7K49_040011 [Saguinus oedipus]